MCVGFEGTLAAVAGDGPARSGVLIVNGRFYDVGLAFVPEARPGDRLVAHTGQGVRIVRDRFMGAMDVSRRFGEQSSG